MPEYTNTTSCTVDRERYGYTSGVVEPTHFMRLLSKEKSVGLDAATEIGAS